MKRAKRAAAVAASVSLLLLAGCDVNGGGKKSQNSESSVRQSSYDHQVAIDPAHSMNYSPTRKTINFWIDTWDEPGKLAYVYMLASNGQMVGYYVFEGLPVTYCASLTPNYEFVGTPNDGSSALNQKVPAPGVDGVYYSGGQCNQYYGKDASTGAYIEYFAGQGISPLVYSEPLPRPDVQPLGFTTIAQVAKK